jgi:HKD family nuclease
MAVAFLKESGLKVIDLAMEKCLENGGHVEMIAGLDFKTTDPQAIFQMIQRQKRMPNFKFYCYGDKHENRTDNVFHPKIYLFQGKNEMTGIVGSTNLTKGGLLTHFEVNVIFKENKPIYFSQLEAIYNSVKFTDSVFTPDEEYLADYSDVYKAFLQNEEKANKDKGVQKVIKQIQKREQILPGTVPSIKNLIIQVIRNNQQKSSDFVSLHTIYQEVEKWVTEKKLTYKMDTFRNSIRGELNKHETNSNHPDNMNLFVRSPEQKGYYSLTDKGGYYEGR